MIFIKYVAFLVLCLRGNNIVYKKSLSMEHERDVRLFYQPFDVAPDRINDNVI